MNNYYNELSQLSILKEEIDRFATSLQNKKAGCFIHRFEQLLNVLPNEFRNQFNFRNKIEDYIKKSNYEKDVKDYILQVFLSFFESIEIEVPNSLRNVVKENESYNEAMIEGYLNFEKANFLEQQKIEIITPQQPETNKPDEVKIIDKLKQNKFDDVEPSKVYQHFKQLVDNSYITNENFNLFLSTVFEQNKTLTTKIEIIKPNSKQRVQKIFYNYYEKLVQRKYGTKPKYIDLLCNNFTGFNPETLSTNFAK